MLASTLLRQAQAQPASTPTHFKITLVRSAIGLAPKVRRTVEALHFKRRMQTVYEPINEQSVGKILRVKELVKVERVDRATIARERATVDRSANRGFTVVGRAL